MVFLKSGIFNKMLQHMCLVCRREEQMQHRGFHFQNGWIIMSLFVTVILQQQRAYPRYESSLSIAVEVGDRLGQLQVLSGMAKTLVMMRQFNKVKRLRSTIFSAYTRKPHWRIGGGGKGLGGGWKGLGGGWTSPFF